MVDSFPMAAITCGTVQLFVWDEGNNIFSLRDSGLKVAVEKKVDCVTISLTNGILSLILVWKSFLVFPMKT